jgi:hypothetical protein
MPRIDKVNFRPGPLSDQIEERISEIGGSTSGGVTQRDLGRYYDMLGLGLAAVHLTPGEAGLIVDALNGTLIDINTAQALRLEVEDALRAGLAEKWQIDGSGLVEKIRGYTLVQRMAIADAVERFWNNSYSIDDTAARLVRVGLVRQP